MRRRMSSCSECCLSRKGHRTHFPLKKMERSVCMYVHMWVCTYRTQRGPERPREAQRGPETPREAQRGPERPREAQRGPERPKEAQRGLCTFQDHSRSIPTSRITNRIALLCMYMYVYVHSRTIPGAFPQAKSRPELPCYMYVCMYMCMYVG